MRRSFEIRPRQRLGLVAGVAVLVLAAASAATAGWVTAGNSVLSAHEESTLACADGVQTRLGYNGENAAGPGVPGPFFAAHPWTWIAMTVTQAPALPVPSPPLGAEVDEIVVLPRGLVDTDIGVKLYSGDVQVHTGFLLERGNYVRLWPQVLNAGGGLVGTFSTVGSVPGGFPVQVDLDGCTLPPPPPVGGRGCLGGDPTVIRGTDGDDVLIGTAGNDVIVGGRGNDVIDGLGGHDLLCGGDGEDVILGGPGNDGLDGGAGSDVLGAGTGNDLLLGGDGTDALSGGLGDDILKGGADDDVLVGGFERGSFDPLDGGTGTDLCLQAELRVACE